ncbi:MAG: NTP transferase domain-containing protein [Oscillospiraceae bacterium]|nr:NTP transferase domain-containing protein [Oscillospiraceae bacterium]
MENLKAIILAAGKGTRMAVDGRDVPKVLRTVLGRPMLDYVLRATPVERQEDAVIVVGYKRELVEAAFPGRTFAVQAQQLGTGHAVMSAEEALAGWQGDVLILCGDTPLVRRETLEALVEDHRARGAVCTVLAGASREPMKGLGRVKQKPDGSFDAIVEERDCTPEELAIQVYNSGIYVFRAPYLFSALHRLKTDNAQGEYYLTDAPYILLKDGLKVGVSVLDMGPELLGVNSPAELAQAERLLQGGN